MKKFITTLALLLGSVMAHAHSQQAGPNTDPDNRHECVYVYNADAVAHEVGDVLVWKDGTYDGVEVSSTTTANDALVAGVVAHQPIAANSWGFIQIYGYHSGVTIAVANAAGDNLVTSGTAEASTVYTFAMSTGTATNEATKMGIFATALEATTSSTTVKAMIRLK